MYKSIGSLLCLVALTLSCNLLENPDQNHNYASYFPIGDNYKWTYTRDSTLRHYSFKRDTSRTDGQYYSYYQEERVIEWLELTGDSILSLMHNSPGDSAVYYIWKNNLVKNMEWTSYRESYGGPRLIYKIKHKVVDLNAIISFDDKHYDHCIVIEREYTVLAGYKERCYYAKNIGLVYTKGVSLFTDGPHAYEEKLVSFSR